MLFGKRLVSWETVYLVMSRKIELFGPMNQWFLRCKASIKKSAIAIAIAWWFVYPVCCCGN